MEVNKTKTPLSPPGGASTGGAGCSHGAASITANLRFDEGQSKSKGRGSWVDSGRKKLGAVFGDGAKTGINASIFPGGKVGRGAWVGPGAIVDRDVPSNARYKTS